MRQNVYDSQNRLIGFLLETSNQVQVYDKSARLIGYYNKSSDLTFKNGIYFSRGDQTMRIIRS